MQGCMPLLQHIMGAPCWLRHLTLVMPCRALATMRARLAGRWARRGTATCNPTLPDMAMRACDAEHPIPFSTGSKRSSPAHHPTLAAAQSTHAGYWELLSSPESQEVFSQRARSASDAAVLRRKGHLKEQV